MHRTLSILAAALACGCAASTSPVEPVEPVAHAAVASAHATLAFVHVAVVPMDREIVLDDQTVLVDGDTIVSVGASARTAVPEGARVIDGRGAFLMPGLADMHVHTWDENDLYVFVANGVTTVRNMFGDPMHLAWRKRIESGELVGPQIYTAGPIVDGDPPVWPGSAVLVDPANAEQLALDQRDAGYDFLKPYSRLKADAYDALVAAGAKHGMALMGHVPPTVGLERVLASGQRTIEHLDGWVNAAQADGSPFTPPVAFRDEYAAWSHVDDAKLVDLARRTRDAGTWNCPTLVTCQKWVQGDAARELLARPQMRYVSPMMRAAWEPESQWNYLSTMPPEIAAAARHAVREEMRAVLALHNAGAHLLAGTDMGNPYVTPGFALHEELANFVQAGLSPYEALRAATVEGAACMGGNWGVVAAGSRADLLLLDANPLADVGNAAKRRGVCLRGRWLAERELEDELEARAERWDAAAQAK